MRTGGEILQGVIVRGNIATTSSYYTDANLRTYINDAYRWAVSLHKWPFTEGRNSTTFASLVTNDAGDLQGQLPEGWRTDSVRMLQIGGKRLQKLNLEDYQIFREDRASANDRVFADLGRLYFVNPGIDLSGTVTAYGQYTPALLDLGEGTSSTDTTVFSDSEEEGNEAICYAALAYGKMKEKKNVNEAQFYQTKAVEILEGIWKRTQDEQFAYQTKDRGMFYRFDVLRGEKYGDITKRDQF